MSFEAHIARFVGALLTMLSSVLFWWGSDEPIVGAVVMLLCLTGDSIVAINRKWQRGEIEKEIW